MSKVKARLGKFRELRKSKGLRLKDIAKELKISDAYCSMIEVGNRRLDYEMAITMAKIFDMKPDELFYDDVVNDYKGYGVNSND